MGVDSEATGTFKPTFMSDDIMKECSFYEQERAQNSANSAKVSPGWFHQRRVLLQQIDSVFTRRDHIVYDPDWGIIRQNLATAVDSLASDLVMTAVMVLNLIIAIMTVDMEASGQDVPWWLRAFLKGLVAAYTAEVGARIYVYRWHFFLTPFNQFDVLVVSADLISIVCEFFFEDVLTPDFAIFRIVRVMRLLRSAKILVLFRSLYLLVHGMAGAMRAVMWALLMISLALVLCSIFAVVVIQPYVDELANTTQVFDDCGRCAIAFSSVWHAYMTFFQNIVAGDSWGAVTIPVMDAHPWTAFFFIPVLLLIQLGLINMILAVIVDRAQDAREADNQLRLELKEQKAKRAEKEMHEICRSMDVDASGELTLDEMLEGYDTNQQFKDTLKLMDIGREDISLVFRILDVDRSGSCSYSEFVESLWKMKAQDPHTLLVFIKTYVIDVKHFLEEQFRELHEDMASKLSDLHQQGVIEKQNSGKTNTLGLFDWPKVPLPQLTLVRADVSENVDTIRSDRYGSESSRRDVPRDEGVTMMLKHMSETIERKLDKLAKILAGPSSRCSEPQVVFTDAGAQQEARTVPAACCFPADLVSVRRAPKRTVAMMPPDTRFGRAIS